MPGTAIQMTRLTERVDALKDCGKGETDHSAAARFGLIAHYREVHVKRVSIFQPILIVVLSGCKTIYAQGRFVRACAGEVLALSAPAIIDLTNEPAANSRLYKSLIIPFNAQLLKQVKNQTNGKSTGGTLQQVIKYEQDPLLLTSLEHYLEHVGSLTPAVLEHRLLEILIVLIERNAALLDFSANRQPWSQRVRMVLGEDLSKNWEFGELAKRLAVSQSTLRRSLQKEGTGFRDMLAELRLNSGLMQVLQTSQPINQIALDSGYQSVSRFTQNFHRRFGLPPRKLRDAMKSHSE